MAIDGRPAREGRTSFYTELSANLCAGLSVRAVQLRDVGRWPSPPRVRTCRRMETQPINRPLKMTAPVALPREDASSGSRASRAGVEAPRRARPRDARRVG